MIDSLDTKPESDAGKNPLKTEVCIYCISKGNDNMSKAFAPLLLKVFGLLPQNYTHLTLKSALTRDERQGRPEALHSVNPPQFTNWPKKPSFLIYHGLYCKCVAFFNHPP